MKYIVYITINTKNNKMYIGVHSTEDPTLFDGYIGCGVNIFAPSTYKKDNKIHVKISYLKKLMIQSRQYGNILKLTNCEKHRTFISTHRSDVEVSAAYKPMEQVFIQIGKGQQDDPVYQMNTAEKDCLDTFMAARNQALV